MLSECALSACSVWGELHYFTALTGCFILPRAPSVLGVQGCGVRLLPTVSFRPLLSFWNHFEKLSL